MVAIVRNLHHLTLSHDLTKYIYGYEGTIPSFGWELFSHVLKLYNETIIIIFDYVIKYCIIKIM